VIAGFLEEGVKSIKKLSIEAWDAKHPEEQHE